MSREALLVTIARDAMIGNIPGLERFRIWLQAGISGGADLLAAPTELIEMRSDKAMMNSLAPLLLVLCVGATTLAMNQQLGFVRHDAR